MTVSDMSHEHSIEILYEIGIYGWYLLADRAKTWTRTPMGWDGKRTEGIDQFIGTGCVSWCLVVPHGELEIVIFHQTCEKDLTWDLTWGCSWLGRFDPRLHSIFMGSQWGFTGVWWNIDGTLCGSLWLCRGTIEFTSTSCDLKGTFDTGFRWLSWIS